MTIVEVLQMESSPDGGFERFTSSEIRVTDEEIPFSSEALDRTGRKLVKRWGVADYVAVRGTARIRWMSPEDREKNIDYQSEQRWQDVQGIAQLMRKGEWDFGQQGPVFIYGPRLRPVDGARRIMAAIEAELNSIDVVILRTRQR